MALAAELGIYAYDAYYLQCARQYRSPLLSLDGGLLSAARGARVQTMEVNP